MRGFPRACVVALSTCFLFSIGVSGVRADPSAPPWPSWPAVVDRAIPPPPPLTHPDTNPPPIAVDPGQSPHLNALRAASMPSPVGDPFFDAWPDRLAGYANGQVIDWRDVTASAAPLLAVPMQRVIQLKFRTTDAHGAPSFGTATLAVPAAPWHGAGTRPVVVNNIPVDALGRACSSGFTLAHGISLSTNVFDFIPPATYAGVLRGYAVLIPDHEGPRMAYAEPYVAGHIVLDSIRATRRLLPQEFGPSRFGLTGYSGGSIATLGAAKLIDGYAPELATSIVGAALGGVPADFGMLTHTMNGNLASGVFLAAVLGIGRERPEILGMMNHFAEWVATSPLKDACTPLIGVAGLAFAPVDVAADQLDPLDSPVAREVLQATHMTGMKSGTPLFIYNGDQEWWIPAAGAREVFAEQCALGVNARYLALFGEHGIAAVTGFLPAMSWLDQRLQGVPAADGCPS